MHNLKEPKFDHIIIEDSSFFLLIYLMLHSYFHIPKYVYIEVKKTIFGLKRYRINNEIDTRHR